MTPLYWYLLMILPATCLYIYGLIKDQNIREGSLALLVIAVGFAFVIMTIIGIAGIVVTATGGTL